MKKTLSLLTLCVLTACGQANKPANEQVAPTAHAEQSIQSESERLNQWFDEQYEASLLRSPMMLTRLGRKERYAEFDDFSEAREAEYLQLFADSVAELQSTFDYEKLEEDVKISYDLWLYQYQAAKAMVPFQRSGYVFTQMHGSHASLPNFLINFHRVDELEDMQAYNKRIVGLSMAIE